MNATLKLGSVVADLVRKDIKNVHLSVHPPEGRVRIAVPQHMNEATVRAFAISKIAWIKKQQRSLREQERETPREYLEKESHYVWGRRYLLRIVDTESSPSVELKARHLVMYVRFGATPQKRHEILEAWYRTQLREKVTALMPTWETRLGVIVEKVFIQRMKTKWGSCSRTTPTIRLNTELAKKPVECLEYVLVHEMLHLLEANHGPAFLQRFDGVLPTWRGVRRSLNALPVGHVDWRN